MGADTALKKLLADYPRSLDAAAGFVIEGEIAIERARSAADYEAARSTFRRVSLLGNEEFPALDARVLARLRSAEVGLQLGDRAGALAELLAAIEDEAPGRFRGRAKLLYGRTLLADPSQTAAGLQVLQELADEAAPAAPGAGRRRQDGPGGQGHLDGERAGGSAPADRPRPPPGAGRGPASPSGAGSPATWRPGSPCASRTGWRRPRTAASWWSTARRSWWPCWASRASCWASARWRTPSARPSPPAARPMFWPDRRSCCPSTARACSSCSPRPARKRRSRA